MKEKVAAIQMVLGVTVDGIWGPKTQAALEALLAPPICDGVDERSETNIATLHVKVQPLARELIRQAIENGMAFKITGGTRTYEEQEKLYAQGRTEPGKIVTNARPGFSSHNFATAFDVTLFNGKQPVWESPHYLKLGKIGKALGLSWGGDWNSQDLPHWYLKPDYAKDWSEGAMMSELRRRHDNNIDAFA